MGQTVFNNNMVAHVWAQQNQPHGRNAGHSFSFSYEELISYGTTVALHYGRFVLAANNSFSVTTTQQLSQGCSAVSCPVITVDGIFSRGKRFNYKGDKPTGVEIRKALLAMILEKAKSYDARKRDSTRAQDWNAIQGMLEDLKTVCEAFSIKYPKGYSDATEALGMTAATVAKLARAKKAAEKKRQKAAEKKREEYRYQLNQWLEGDSLPSGIGGERRLVSCPYVFQTTQKAQLTVFNGTVYTTGHAEAPLEHVKQAFKLYRHIRKSGEAWTRSGDTRARLGHFELDYIDAQGNAKAGCHTFTAQELERFAAKWEL